MRCPPLRGLFRAPVLRISRETLILVVPLPTQISADSNRLVFVKSRNRAHRDTQPIPIQPYKAIDLPNMLGYALY